MHACQSEDVTKERTVAGFAQKDGMTRLCRTASALRTKIWQRASTVQVSKLSKAHRLSAGEHRARKDTFSLSFLSSAKQTVEKDPVPRKLSISYLKPTCKQGSSAQVPEQVWSGV